MDGARRGGYGLSCVMPPVVSEGVRCCVLVFDVGQGEKKVLSCDHPSVQE